MSGYCHRSAGRLGRSKVRLLKQYTKVRTRSFFLTLRRPALRRNLNRHWIRNGLALIAAFAFAAIAHGADFTDVFTAGRDGYHTYRIPAIVVTTNGTMLAFCEGRKNSRSDSGDIDMLVKRSADGGKTWSAQQLIWSDGSNTCGNPAPVVDRTTGIVWLLMTWNNGVDKEDQIHYSKARDTRRVFIAQSADDGLTWTRPKDITDSVKKPEWGWYATGPVNGIQLTRGSCQGRLVIPANHSSLSTATQIVSQSHCIYSDDHGATWKLGGTEDEKTNESTLVELAGGYLMQNMRSYHNRNHRAVATSKDCGQTWSQVKLDETLLEPVCQASILRCTWPEAGDKSRILFSNPAGAKREKLTVRVSYDEGATWPVSKELHPGLAAYSCMTMLPDKSVGCLFENGQKNSYEKISLARFSVAWLEDSKP